jgi:hypothetical protein
MAAVRNAKTKRARAAYNAKPITEETTMSDRTNYGTIAEKIDYTKLEKKLEQLREQEPPKKRKSAGDVLAPVRDKLAELHAAGWTYAQLAAELNSAGMPVKVGTLRECLGHGHGAKPSAKRRSRKRRMLSAATAGR